MQVFNSFLQRDCFIFKCRLLRYSRDWVYSSIINWIISVAHIEYLQFWSLFSSMYLDFHPNLSYCLGFHCSFCFWYIYHDLVLSYVWHPFNVGGRLKGWPGIQYSFLWSASVSHCRYTHPCLRNPTCVFFFVSRVYITLFFSSYASVTSIVRLIIIMASFTGIVWWLVSTHVAISYDCAYHERIGVWF